MEFSQQNGRVDEQLLKDTLADLERDLLERGVAVRLLLLAALAGEHVLLVGPPGTAKSELARRLQRAFVGARYFERLLTRFSVPEELFGPLSLKALEEDRYERLTDGFLPTAQIAFLDEVFKANSAILNALLTLLNEREFDNGSGRVKVPLISVVGATNGMPDDEALQAFCDRFLLRVPVEPVQDGSFGALLALPTGAPAITARLTVQDLVHLRHCAATVCVPQEVTDLLGQARAWCRANALTVSDRRWRKLVALLSVQAASRAATTVAAWDLWLLPFALAQRPAQVEPLVQWFLATVAQAVPLDLQWLVRAQQAYEKQLEIEGSALAMDDAGAGKLALARAIVGDTANDPAGMVRIVARAALRRYSHIHIDARVAQVDEAVQRAQLALEGAQAIADAVLPAAREHLWLPPLWLAQIEAVHQANLDAAQALREGLLELRQDFATLPVDGRSDGVSPAPMALAA